MKKKLLILIALTFIGCGAAADEVMFKNNVINPIPSSIQNISMVKGRSAMHGALFFEFDATADAVQAIVQKNDLTPETEIPDVIATVISNSPWSSSINANTTDVYGKIIEDKYEWHALYLFVTDQKVYCMKM